MASQSVLELAVNTGKWDSGLKKAKSALDNFTTASGGLQQALGKDADKMQKFVQMMGSMESKAKTAKGQMNDYKGTIEQLTMQYNRMTEAQQKTIGQEYLNTIEQLKKKYHDVSQEQQEMNRSLQNTNGAAKDSGGVLDELTKRFTVNIDAVKLFNVGLQAAQGALKVAKDAFFYNEQQLDAWGAAVEASESLYKGFLNALNTGDINGYLNNINQIVRAAESAYNALDALGTFNAFNQVNVEKTRTNMSESIVDYREGKGDKEAVRAAGDAYKKELEERRRLEQEAYIEAIGKVAAERGVSKQDLIDALSGSYGHYKDLKNVQPTGTVTKYSPGIMPGSQGSYTTYTVAQGKQEKLGEALRQLNDTELQSLQALGAQAQRTGNEIAQVDRQLIRVLNGKQGNGSGGGSTTKLKEILPAGSVAELNRQMQELRKQQSLVTSTDEWKQYEDKIKDVNNQIRELKGELGIESLRGLKGVSISDSIKPLTREDIIKKGQASIENFKMPEQPEKRDALEDARDIVSGLQSVSSGLQQMGIELPEGVQKVIGVVQGIMNVIQGVQTILEVFGTSSMTANTTMLSANTTALGVLSSALAANTAAVTTNTVTPSIFAGGGIVHAAGGFRVPGHSFSGDRVPALLNSGELVLNTGQQEVVAQALMNNNGGGRTYSGSDYVSGQNVFIGTNNYLRGSGQGQLVTTRMLRQYGLIH